MFAIDDFPNEFYDPKNATLLSGILRGIEREALRTSYSGELSQKPHPITLGSALTHPQITTDFSESLLEFITPPTHRVEDLFQHLESIHKYTHANLDEELLWSTSMPCGLGDDYSIPVARYGSSNNGTMKTIYRLGLGHRYGRAMQTVSGVHYNFSLPNAFWALLATKENTLLDLQEFKNQKYFDLIRNFRRHYWLLIYLFGASPALCASFVGSNEHQLEQFGDGHTLYSPYATSLRMGDLGYQSKTQESLYVCYNDAASYIKTLCRAITTQHAAYEQIGLKDDKARFQQLNTCILQIENEFYSAIRPKRTAYPGETALSALQNRGVEYIEVRCLDIDPFSPVGVNQEQVRFLDTFLLYCAMKDSPPTHEIESQITLENQKQVVSKGRDPSLRLKNPLAPEQPAVSLRAWGEDLLQAMEPVAKLLDEAKHTDTHLRALNSQQEKVADPEKTPSARVLRQMRDNHQSFSEFALAVSQQHRQTLTAEPLDEQQSQRMEAMSEESIAEQKALEERSTDSFDAFLEKYYEQYNDCRCDGTQV